MSRAAAAERHGRRDSLNHFNLVSAYGHVRIGFPHARPIDNRGTHGRKVTSNPARAIALASIRARLGDSIAHRYAPTTAAAPRAIPTTSGTTHRTSARRRIFERIDCCIRSSSGSLAGVVPNQQSQSLRLDSCRLVRLRAAEKSASTVLITSRSSRSGSEAPANPKQRISSGRCVAHSPQSWAKCVSSRSVSSELSRAAGLPFRAITSVLGMNLPILSIRRPGRCLNKLRPDIHPVIAQLLACHLATGQPFDCNATTRRRYRFFAHPLADQPLRDTKFIGEPSLPVLAVGKEGWKIHGRNIRTSLFISKEKKALLIVEASHVLATLIRIALWLR